MTLEQIEGNEPIHENWGAETGDSIDEVRLFKEDFIMFALL